MKIVAKVPYAQDVPNGNETIVHYVHDIASSLLTGSKKDMMERLQNKVSGNADTLFLDISRARDKIFTKFPEIKTKYDQHRSSSEH